MRNKIIHQQFDELSDELNLYTPTFFIFQYFTLQNYWQNSRDPDPKTIVQNASLVKFHVNISALNVLIIVTRFYLIF